MLGGQTSKDLLVPPVVRPRIDLAVIVCGTLEGGGLKATKT